MKTTSSSSIPPYSPAYTPPISIEMKKNSSASPSPTHTRTTSLEERSSLLLGIGGQGAAAGGGGGFSSDDDDTLFTTPSNSFNRLGGPLASGGDRREDRGDRRDQGGEDRLRRRSPSPRPNNNNNPKNNHPSAAAVAALAAINSTTTAVDLDQEQKKMGKKKKMQSHSVGGIGSQLTGIIIPGTISSQQSGGPALMNSTTTISPANSIISPPNSMISPSTFLKNPPQMQRNNSSGSLASASALNFHNRMNSFAGSIPNGINQQTFPGGAKRSFAGIGVGNPQQQQQFTQQQFFPQFVQQQFFNNSAGRSSLLYAAALNNLQQNQGQNPAAQNLQNFQQNVQNLQQSPNIPQQIPPQQERYAESVTGESNISGGPLGTGAGGAGGIGGSGESSGSPKSSSKKGAKKSSTIRSHGGFVPQQLEPLQKHRGELSLNEKYRYDLSRAQLKASSRTSALLSGFAMIALVELQYMQDTPKPLLIMLGVVTTLLVSVHLLALMMSTCLLPYIEANGCTQDSPHIKLKFYIELSWIFSTCIGLLLFLLEIGVIFFVKFNAIGYNFAAYITTGMLIPVLIIFIVISYLIHRNRFTHSIERVNDKVVDLQKYLVEAEMGAANQQTSMGPHATNSIQRNMVSAGLQGVTVVRNFKD